MNRRQKIIVSVTGIFIVLLILVGLTYAYFLTQIRGNENDKSISVTTANLELVYGDGTNKVITGEKIVPGTTIGEKDFTVTNKGDATDYVVVIENVSVTYAETIGNVVAGSETTFNSPTDFVYTLTCTKSDGTSCEGVSETSFPMSDSIIVGNNIDVGDVHTYVLTVTYIETGVDQSLDMNKKLEARVNIKDINTINPYSDNEDSLAYNIINNAMLNKNETKLVATPPSKVAEEVSLENWEDGEQNVYAKSLYYAETEKAFRNCFFGYEDENGEIVTDCSEVTETDTCTDNDVGKYVSDENDEPTKVIDCVNGKPVIGTTKYENVLSVTSDDYGTSYYYRGNVNDNYVNFADMCWRIVRIQGDGSIKLILEDKNTTCESVTNLGGNWEIEKGTYGFKYYEAGTLTASDGTTTNTSRIYVMDYLHGGGTYSMATVFKSFQESFTADEISKLKSGDWCMADSAYSRNGTYPSYTYTLLNDTEILDYKVSRTEIYYDSVRRLSANNKDGYQPTLKCTGRVLEDWEDDTMTNSKMYVGALTADEIVYAGGKVGTANYNYYLMNDYSSPYGLNFWSLSPNIFDKDYDEIDYPYGLSDTAFIVESDGSISTNPVHAMDYYTGFRPSIILSSSASITDGVGTLEKPYIIG